MNEEKFFAENSARTRKITESLFHAQPTYFTEGKKKKG